MNEQQMQKTIEALQEKIDALEKEQRRLGYYADMEEIANLQARYMYYLENNRMVEIWDELFAHECPDVSMQLMDSGKYIGPEHVRRVWYQFGGRLDRDGNPTSATQPRLPNNNCLLTITISTPIIVVDKEGEHAWGQWHLFGPHSNYVFDAQTGGKKHEQFWIAGKYDNEYVKEHGVWKIKKLRPIGWIRAPYDKGWLRQPDCRRTPNPYDPPDEPGVVTSWHPDARPSYDMWGPMPPAWVDYRQ